jgi:hypothetical protein
MKLVHLLHVSWVGKRGDVTKGGIAWGVDLLNMFGVIGND